MVKNQAHPRLYLHIVAQRGVLFMGKPVFLISGQSIALDHAKTYLAKWHCPITETPDKSVTHLLLPVPLWDDTGISSILAALPPTVTVMGGNLQKTVFEGYACQDFLKDPWYLSENADITAYGAVRLAMEKLPVTLSGCPVLVIGWGRIGKCLARLLRQMGARVSISTRDEGTRAILSCLGYDTLSLEPPCYSLMRYRLIFNTAPATVISTKMLEHCTPDCIKIDLASVKGIEGDDVLWARGLPAKLYPESSGELIARTALRLAREQEA